jgi:hypothetical protein
MFSLKKLYNGIYLLSFDKNEDLAAHFLRYQEYYESPVFYKKPFQIIDFVKWYASTKEHGKFSYLTDWHGFNIPASIIKECYLRITDKNDHDELMYSIYKLMEKEHPNPYLIGVSSDLSKGSGTLDHEIAHAIYSFNEEYRIEVIESMKTYINDELYKELKEQILSMGYHENVVDDEINAYISTGGFSGVDDNITRRFVYLFHVYKNKLT